jgi:hypothetical protein
VVVITETNFVTNTVYTVATQAVSAVGTAQAVNAIVPSPYQPFITIGLALFSGLLGIVAKIKSDKAKLLPTIIRGVEAAANNEAVKRSIENVSVSAGQWEKLHTEVRKFT